MWNLNSKFTINGFMNYNMLIINPTELHFVKELRWGILFQLSRMEGILWIFPMSYRNKEPTIERKEYAIITTATQDAPNLVSSKLTTMHEDSSQVLPSFLPFLPFEACSYSFFLILLSFSFHLHFCRKSTIEHQTTNLFIIYQCSFLLMNLP